MDGKATEKHTLLRGKALTGRRMDTCVTKQTEDEAGIDVAAAAAFSASILSHPFA